MKELQEKDFIQEKRGKNPFPVWFWMLVVVSVLVAVLVVVGQIISVTNKNVEESPFLKVSNRDFSIFLWSHPEFMRANYRGKSGYLPDFQMAPKVTPQGAKADNWVQAPPEVLFEYQQWKRFIGDILFPRPISSIDLQNFLEYDEQWRPEYWKEAPQGYADLINQLNTKDISEQLPKNLRQAYVGWKNYYLEGGKIVALPNDSKMIETFLNEYPAFKPNYWKNIYPHYLESLGKKDPLPNDEVPPFLKTALYNYNQKKS